MKKADIKALDRLFSQYMRMLSGGYCKKCGKYFDLRDLDTCHFHSRKKHATRWEAQNVIVMCKPCHAKMDDNPFKKYELFCGILGSEEFCKLNERAEHLRPDIDTDKLKAEFKEGIKRLEE